MRPGIVRFLKNVLCVLPHSSYLLFQGFDCCSVVLWGDGGSGFKEEHVNNAICLGFEFFFCRWTSLMIFHGLTLGFRVIMMHLAWYCEEIPHLLCYHSALFFCHIHLIALSCQARNTECALQNQYFSFWGFYKLQKSELQNLELLKFDKCLYLETVCSWKYLS